eukprot:3921740-Heterocapsa_arctica.AAC.1
MACDKKSMAFRQHAIGRRVPSVTPASLILNHEMDVRTAVTEMPPSVPVVLLKGISNEVTQQTLQTGVWPELHL